MKSILAPVLFFISLTSYSQTVVFHENMETIDSVFSSGSPGWFANTNLQVSGVQCDSSSVIAGGTSVLETSVMDFTGYTFVIFSFNHICKTSFFDQAIVEVFDGTSWIQLTAQNMVPGQPDSANFDGQNNNFSEGIYPDWQPGILVSPDNSWWKSEVFDISSIVGNVTNAKIRFTLSDQNAPGSDGRAGWFIDDILVNAAPCELFPPSLTQTIPVLQGTVLSLGPYTLNISLTDPSGIDTASVFLIYTINGGLPDTVVMNNTTGNIFSGTIPAVNDSDTVCYYFNARDASPCNNLVVYPALNCIQFIAREGLSVPFCDDFDFDNFWVATTTGGSIWQYGTPTGSPASAHSAPNAWEVMLGAQYGGNTNTYLESPDISFLNVNNASINFWFYRDCESNWDGTRLEYSISQGASWVVLGNVGTGSNWYNIANLLSSNLPGWSGLPIGWTNAEHNLAAVNNQPFVRFRFVFTSDASVQGNGFAVDDFCITVPAAYDVGATVVSSANGSVLSAGTIDSVIVSIKNFGANPVDSIPVYFSINSGTPVGPFIYTGTINPGLEVTGILLSGFNYTAPNNAFSLCAWTELSPDNIFMNDTSCTGIAVANTFNITDSISYCDSFDGLNYGWTSVLLPSGSASTVWELGPPNFGATNSAHSPPNAWDINLNAAYTNNANVALLSPFFSVSTNANAKVAFWHNYNTEAGWDGVELEYTSDGGLTWNNIGTIGDTAATNWYNGNAQCSNQNSWQGNSLGWVYSEYRDLDTLNGQTVQFRFVFCSDAVITTEGYSVDDFCFGRDTGMYVTVNEMFEELDIALDANVPNPFSEATDIEYSIPQNGFVQITVTDIAGRIVSAPLNEIKTKGKHVLKFKASGLTPGLYFYSLKFRNKLLSRKMVLTE